jgi:hypothetical protein
MDLNPQDRVDFLFFNFTGLDRAPQSRGLLEFGVHA